MGTKNKKNSFIKQFGNKASHLFGLKGNCLDHMQQLNRNSGKFCLAGKYLQSINLKCVEQHLRSLLKEKTFKHAGILLNNLETHQANLKEQ